MSICEALVGQSVVELWPLGKTDGEKSLVSRRLSRWSRKRKSLFTLPWSEVQYIEKQSNKSVVLKLGVRDGSKITEIVV